MTLSRPASERRPESTRFVPWQLGIAAVAIAVGVFFALRAGQDFNRWVLTLMWFAVGVIWIVLWRREVLRRRRLQPGGTAGSAEPTP